MTFTRPSRLIAILPPALIFAFTCLLFSRSTQNEFLPFDDEIYITQNPQVSGGLTGESIRWAFTSGQGANWFPLTRLSHMLDVSFFGIDSQAHHATNIVLHALNSMLLYVLCLRYGAARSAAAVIALLFAAHPLHVESVAWVSSRKDLLSALFWILGLFAYRRFAGRRTPGNYAWVGAAFVAALLSKPVAVTFPFTLLLLDYWPLARLQGKGADRRRQLLALIVEKLPLIALAVVFSAITFVVQRQGGAMHELTSLSLGARISNGVFAYIGYLAHFIWPIALYFPYPHAGETQPLWGAALAGGLLIAITMILYMVRSARPTLLWGWLWFIVILLPTIGLIQVGFQSMADRYMYLPALGLIVIAVQFGADASARSLRSGPIRVCVAAAVILALAVLTWRQQAHWRNGRSLFAHAIAMQDDNVPARIQLGVVYLRWRQPALAEEQCRAALQYDPHSIQAWSNLGSALQMQSRLPEAEAAFRRALELAPDSYSPQLNLATTLAAMDRLDEALVILERVTRSPEESGEGRALLDELRARRSAAPNDEGDR